MWEHCGVVKNKKSLLLGLEKVRDLKKILREIDVRVDENNCEDLTLILDLQSSILSSEATIISSLERKESRGAHQRSDYPSISPNEKVNYLIKHKKQTDKMEVSSIKIKPLRADLENVVRQEHKENLNMKGKLLE